MNLNRRNFIQTLALAGAAAFLPFGLTGCDEAEVFEGSGKVPFKVWEEMLHAFMTSSDYLPGRVKDLIASKDAEAMYNFVKNEIVLIPNRAFNLSGMGTKIKWGTPGVLRCGMANPREKAELLHYMYQKAGITSKVVFERTKIKAEEVPAFFYRPVDRKFNPKISKSQIRSWEKAMGFSEGKSSGKEFVKDYLPKAEVLGKKILHNIGPFDKYSRAFDFRWDNYKTPAVEFTQEGKTKYAHLFDPNMAFGSLRDNGSVSPAGPVQENNEEISLKISYRNNIEPDIEKELVSGKWLAKDVIGKQIIIGFLHGLTFEEQVVTPIGNVRTFTPALSLQAIDESVAYMNERSFLGDPITIDGKTLKIDKQGKVGINDSTLMDKPNQDLQKMVTEISVCAQTGGYPIVKLNVNVKDRSGNLIEGLSPKDFVIFEDGKSVKALMENNQRTPKILVLSDSSFSMPEQYYKEGMKRFNKQLKQSILKKYPSAIIDFWKTPSELFTWLLKASKTDADLIIYATDGDNKDTFNEKNIEVYKAGPPALILNVINRESKNYLDTFNKMAEITNGTVINAKDQDKTLDEIVKRIESLDISPYVLSYASADIGKKHEVKVAIDNNRLQATDSYQFPKKAGLEKNGIIGIYLELTVGKNRPVRRVLAGWDLKNENYDPKRDYSKNIQGLLFGSVLLAFEAEGPTLSTALTDLLKSKLTNRNWGEAYLENDIKKAKEEIEKGVINIPAILVSMMAPLQQPVTDKSLTFSSGYRMCLLKTIVGVDQPTVFMFDYLPTSKYVSLTKDKNSSFATTVSKTSQLAVREATLFEQSTYSLLRVTQWVNRDAAKQENWLKDRIGYENSDYRYWRESVFRGDGSFKIFDTKAGTKAFWKINQESGEMYGITPDGAGGGYDELKTQLDELSEVMKIYQEVISLMTDSPIMSGSQIGLGITSLGIVAQFGITLVKLAASASEAIMIMDASTVLEEMDQFEKSLQLLACNVAKDVSLGVSGTAGTILGGLDKVISLMVGDNNNPFTCK